MAKKKSAPQTKLDKVSLEKVSDETLDNNYAPTDNVPQEPDRTSDEAKTLMMQQDFLNRFAKPAFESAKNARRKYDQEWIARNLFWRGYQFSRYLPQTQTVVLSSRQNARVPINLITAYMRAIRNQITSFRPKWEVAPANSTSPQSKVQARYEQRLLDYLWDHLKLKWKVKKIITQALLYSVGGPWQIVWNDQKKDVEIWGRDTFDFFIDPLAEEYSDEAVEFVVIAVRRAVAEVTHNSDFNFLARREIASGDATLAASEYKQFMIQAIRQVSPRINENSPTLIVYEGYFKRRRDDGTVYMVKCVWTRQNMTPLIYEEIETDEFDFCLYIGDLNPNEIYGESWIKHAMAINRVINSLESSAFEYNYRVAKGRIVVDKDAGIKSISNVHGEIISKNKGAVVESLDIAPLPVAVPEQIQRMWHYMEDITGLHEASLGRIPTGVKSGVGVAELKQGDSTSQDDFVDNLEDFLQEVSRKLLKKIAQNMDTHQIIKDLGVREADTKYFAVIGDKFNRKNSQKAQIPGKEGQIKVGPDWFDVASIKEDNQVRVTVGSWLGYTKDAMQQKVIQYYQLQLIDQATALRLLEFGDIDSIVQQTRIEGLLKKPPMMGANGQPQVDQYSLAQSENDMINEGKVGIKNAVGLVTPDQDHIVHIAVHQDALGGQFDEVIGLHIDAHQHFLGVLPSSQPAQGGQVSSMPNQMVPQAGSTGGPMNPQQVSGAMPQPGMPTPPAPMGMPGQNLPQQNIPQALASVNQQAATNLTPAQG